MKYHIFFTAQYTEPCLTNGRFGATSVNSLVDVKKDDVAFLFDGLKWKIFGPLNVLSENQFYEINDIYGSNKRNVINYPNRVAFDIQGIKEIALNKLFSLEASPASENYLLNRTLLSVIIANKQVHSTPLTNDEGNYLNKMVLSHGAPYPIRSNILKFDTNETVLDNVIRNRKTKSESIFEMLLMTNKPSEICEIGQNALLYNQFILGIQRQIDIFSISDVGIKIIEIKKRDNKTNPYTQVIEYLDYVCSDFRLNFYKKRQNMAIVLLEEGNKYLDKNQIPAIENLSVYSFNCDKNYKITISN